MITDQEIDAASREGFILLKEAALNKYRESMSDLETVADCSRWETSSQLWEEYNQAIEDLRRFL